MSAAPDKRIEVVADAIHRFGLTSLCPALRACEALAVEGAPLDVAVVGQFKSGKSSLLNALLGETVFPVGAVPVTAVVTRVVAGPALTVRVTRLDGAVEEVAPQRLAEFVTEAGNPKNRQQVAVVDVFTPALRNWPGIRLVDTPGLGSVFTHNTEATRAWMPNVTVALVTVSAERPFSEEDRRLVVEARQTAARVVVVLTKVDLLSETDLREVNAHLDRSLRESFGVAVTVLPFSCRAETARWVRHLQEAVLLPVARDTAGERRVALDRKLGTLLHACKDYLTVGLTAAQRADADREQLRACVLTESVSAAVIEDELRLAEQRVREKLRPAFAEFLLAQQDCVERRIARALAADVQTWQGNLARQTQQYEAWMGDRLREELTIISQDVVPRAEALFAEAEERLRRVVEAFRDRLRRNLHASTGLTISSPAWEAKRPQAVVVPVAVSRAFMTNWDLLWWLLPMKLVGGLFRRHLLGLVPWEVTKNLTRLASDWSETAAAAVADLRTQATQWVHGELSTLERLLGEQPAQATVYQTALCRLNKIEPLATS